MNSVDSEQPESGVISWKNVVLTLFYRRYMINCIDRILWFSVSLPWMFLLIMCIPIIFSLLFQLIIFCCMQPIIPFMTILVNLNSPLFISGELSLYWSILSPAMKYTFSPFHMFIFSFFNFAKTLDGFHYI